MTTLERTADLAAVLFHAQFADPTQSILFMMNLAIAGGFLVLAAREAGDWSVDARRA
jgi:putative oxidoreductase